MQIQWIKIQLQINKIPFSSQTVLTFIKSSRFETRLIFNLRIYRRKIKCLKLSILSIYHITHKIVLITYTYIHLMMDAIKCLFTPGKSIIR